MASPAPSPTPSERRLQGIRLFFALAAVAAAGIASSTCSSTTKGATLGTCTNADNTVFAYNMSQGQCQSSCPSCTWHQNQ